MHDLECGGGFFGSVDQAETNAVNGKDGREEQSEQEEGNKDLRQGHSRVATAVAKFHIYHNQPIAFRRQTGQLRNSCCGNYVGRNARYFVSYWIRG